MSKSSILQGIVVFLAVLSLVQLTAFADRVDELTRQLRIDSDYKVRLNAALNLGKLSDPRAVPALTDALRDKDKTVRGVAAAALGRVVDGRVEVPARERAIAELKRVSTGDPDTFVRSQARKSHDLLLSMQERPAQRAIYVEVGPMTDGTKKGAAVLAAMRKTVEDTIAKKDPTFQTRWPSGKSPTKADLTRAGTVGAYYVDGTLTTLDVKKSGGAAEISCNVSLLLATYPEKNMFAFLKGGAAVQTGASEKNVTEAKNDCVGAVLEDIVARQVVPTLRARSQ